MARTKENGRKGSGGAGPLVDAAWLAEHLADPDLRLVHVSPTRRTYNRRHIRGAAFGDLTGELGLRGTTPETGDTELEALVPPREHVEATLRRWRVGEGDRIVFYDDVGQNRHAARGYWLLRLYRFPRERLHILDGGLEAWRRAGGETTADVPEADLADALRAPVRLGERDASLFASFEAVRGWSEEAEPANGPTRILDVRSADEFAGRDVRSRRGGHVPGARNRPFGDLLAKDGTLRPVPEMLELVREAGVDPGEVRAVYCQTGSRSALAWFVLHELAGFEQVRNYAGSWEEWGNREDGPIEGGEGTA